MEIPKKIIKDKKEFKLIKEYKHYGLYETSTGYKECFDRFDLGLMPKQYVRGNSEYTRRELK